MTALLVGAILAQTRPAYVLTGLDRVERIAIASLIYAADHDRFPVASSLRVSLRPYAPDIDAMLAPPGAPRGTIGYFLDPRLSGKKLSAVPHPDQTALILAGNRRTVTFEHGKTPLGYADGHGKWADAAAVAKARTIPVK